MRRAELGAFAAAHPNHHKLRQWSDDDEFDDGYDDDDQLYDEDDALESSWRAPPAPTLDIGGLVANAHGCRAPAPDKSAPTPSKSTPSPAPWEATALRASGVEETKDDPPPAARRTANQGRRLLAIALLRREPAAPPALGRHRSLDDGAASGHRRAATIGGAAPPPPPRLSPPPSPPGGLARDASAPAKLAAPTAVRDDRAAVSTSSSSPLARVPCVPHLWSTATLTVADESGGGVAIMLGVKTPRDIGGRGSGSGTPRICVRLVGGGALDETDVAVIAAEATAAAGGSGGAAAGARSALTALRRGRGGGARPSPAQCHPLLGALERASGWRCSTLTPFALWQRASEREQHRPPPPPRANADTRVLHGPPFKCLICADEFASPFDGAALVACRGGGGGGASSPHWACLACWSDYLRAAARDGTADVRCPAFRCATRVPLEFSVHVADARTVAALARYASEALVVGDDRGGGGSDDDRGGGGSDDDGVLRWCPTPGCGCVLAARAETTTAAAALPLMACGECGATACAHCGERGHLGVSCDAQRRFRESAPSMDAIAQVECAVPPPRPPSSWCRQHIGQPE